MSEASAPIALAPDDPLNVLDHAFHDAYAARRERVLAGIGPVVAQIDDRLVLHLRGQRLEGPARTRRYHELKVLCHLPLAIHALLGELRGPLDDPTRARLASLRRFVVGAADSLPFRGLDPELLARQRRIVDASLALLDAVLAGTTVDPAEVTAFIRAQTPDLQRNLEDAARDQLAAIHATFTAWTERMTPEERASVRAVVAVSHMSRPGNIVAQYFTLALGETWEGRFDQEGLHAGRRVLTSETTTDEDAAFELVATHVVDARVASRFFGEESRMDRDVLADAGERILAEMFGARPVRPPRAP
mgnify:CR=1 FL=1